MSTLDPEVYGDPKSSITENDLEPLLEGFSVKEVMILSPFSSTLPILVKKKFRV